MTSPVHMDDDDGEAGKHPADPRESPPEVAGSHGGRSTGLSVGEGCQCLLEASFSQLLFWSLSSYFLVRGYFI